MVSTTIIPLSLQCLIDFGGVTWRGQFSTLFPLILGSLFHAERHGVRYEGDWYVIGYCNLRREIRTFSLARMESVEILPDVFRLPENFDFSKFTGSHFGVHWSDKEYRVDILFDPRVVGYIKERRWHPTQRIDEQPDGSVILSLTVNHLLELKRWVLSWGEMAQVLGPDDLVKDVQTNAVAMTKIYRKKKSPA